MGEAGFFYSDSKEIHKMHVVQCVTVRKNIFLRSLERHMPVQCNEHFYHLNEVQLLSVLFFIRSFFFNLFE